MAEDIGSWALVFETMSLFCCLTNVAMMCFVSSSFVTASFGIERYTGREQQIQSIMQQCSKAGWLTTAVRSDESLLVRRLAMAIRSGVVLRCSHLLLSHHKFHRYLSGW